MIISMRAWPARAASRAALLPGVRQASTCVLTLVVGTIALIMSLSIQRQITSQVLHAVDEDAGMLQLEHMCCACRNRIDNKVGTSTAHFTDHDHAGMCQ